MVSDVYHPCRTMSCRTKVIYRNMLYCLFFFFSSRRRHTRCSRDWSSDVCSSDLVIQAIGDESGTELPLVEHVAGGVVCKQRHVADCIDAAFYAIDCVVRESRDLSKIGRASCRERV